MSLMWLCRWSPKPGGRDYSSLTTVDPQRGAHGVTGIADTRVKSVAVQCSNGQEFQATPSQPVAGGPVHYEFAFPTATACPRGTLSFYDASHNRVASVENLAFETAK